MSAIKLKLQFRSDPGHGWLVVDMTALHLTNLLPTDFSDFSYVTIEKGKFKFALEEDCDAPKFIQRAEDRGLTLNIQEHHTNNRSAIRSWSPISPWSPTGPSVHGSIGPRSHA
jgi:hypothetical protein